MNKDHNHMENNKVIYHKNKNNHMNHKKNIKSVDSVDSQVDRLVEKFKNYNFVPLFRKVSWYLSESQIQAMIDSSENKRNPLAYFATSAKQALNKLKKASD